jgi:hypothetical protein
MPYNRIEITEDAASRKNSPILRKDIVEGEDNKISERTSLEGAKGTVGRQKAKRYYRRRR